MNKYKIRDLAKDFDTPTKDIMDIVSKYSETPKSTMQTLSEDELNIVFDSLTLSNQVDIGKYFTEASSAAEKAAAEKAAAEKAAAEKAAAEKAAAEKAAAEKAAAEKAAAEKAAAEKAAAEKAAAEKAAAEKAKQQAQQTQQRPQQSQQRPQQSQQRPQQSQQRPQQSQQRPQQSQQSQQSQQKTPGQQPVRGKREVRVIDTRSTSAVDLSKYDDKVDKLVPERANKMDGRKEKIKQKSAQNRQTMAQSAKRRQEEQDRIRRMQMQRQKPQQLKVMIPDEIAVGELAARLKKTGAEVVKTLMKMGVMASLSQTIDFDTASLVAMEFGAKVEKEVHVTIEEQLIDDSVDTAEQLEPRSPVVVVMGHVDHGKTSLLDRIRNTHVTAGEAGGITQHIGAYTVDYGDSHITFLDTPGHAAFTSMRARGANITDIAILVVAADDGIMPQTIEAINHAKAAKVPIIVAVNKMDKPEANPDRVMQQLTEHSLIPEEWGGDTIVCKVSAATGDGIDNLLEMLLLTAEMQELKANPNRRAQGAVVEARLDRGRGPVATLLVQNGTLHAGDIIIAGTAVGRVRAMTDYRGRRLHDAGPSTPVEITGLSEVPAAGDSFHAVEDERMARELAEQRRAEARDRANVSHGKVTLDDLFAQIKQGEIKTLEVIVKADVQGSAEALTASLEKLSNDEVKVSVIHSGVGAINENDVLLASTAGAIIVGFNVRPDSSAADSAKRSGVDIRTYRVIYECLDEIEAAMKGLLAPKFREETLGQAEVRKVFRASNIGTVAGCYVTDGRILRGASVRIVRDGVVVHEGEMASLKRFKDDAREVASGFECGISVVGYTDIKEGDVIEAFHQVEIER